MTTVYKKVAKMVRERVQAAVDSGKTIAHGRSWVSKSDDFVFCCAVGAIALNGNDFPGDKDKDWCYEVTAPLLKECGVKEGDIGIVLDAIECGFEGGTLSNWSGEDLEAKAPDWWEKHHKWGKYFRLGAEIDHNCGMRFRV